MIKRKEKILEYELPVRIEAVKEGGYFAFCPLWEECYAQGDTVDEVLSEITAVASTLIEVFQEEGRKIPLRKEKKALLKKDVIRVPVFVGA